MYIIIYNKRTEWHLVNEWAMHWLRVRAGYDLAGGVCNIYMLVVWVVYFVV